MSRQEALSMRIHTIDLCHLGRQHRIASYLLEGAEGAVLIETGPSSCHRALVDGLAEHGFRPHDIRHVFLTHIHLDHAGAAGWWGRQGATVHVHELGAPHLIDPSRLVSSAGRLYGDRMEELWGDIPPCPEERVQIVDDGEILRVAGLEIEALATPGHAAHHHVYRAGDVAFTGDLAAIAVPGSSLIELPTPPPEFDLELWLSSLRRIADLEPVAIYPTHFGRLDQTASHIEKVSRLLREAARLVELRLEASQPRAEILAAFEDWTRAHLLAAGATDAQVIELADFNPPALSLAGILRYWKKKRGLEAGDT